MVSGHIATKANTTTLSEHKSDVEKQWELICQMYPDFVPYCTMQESYTGHAPKTVVGSKAYW